MAADINKWVRPAVFLQKTISPLVELMSSRLFGLADQIAALGRSGLDLTRLVARLALADLRRARRAALVGDVEEVDQFITDYLDGDIRTYLIELRKVELGADRRWKYSRGEARSAVVTALLDPVLGALLGEDTDPFAALDDVRAGLRRQVREFQPVWTHKHRGNKVVLLDSDGSFREEMHTPDLLPGEYEDPRLHRARAMFSTDEWTVLRTYYLDGAESWSDAALAAGHSPALGERVRRKTPRVGAEVERRRRGQSPRR
jgi:hypothetical protein